MSERPTFIDAPGPTEPGGSSSSAESRWIERSQAGDTAAFDQLVRSCQDRVFNACRRMCGSAEDAEDLAQEAFVRAFARIGSFQGRSRFYTWVFKIAMNLALTHRRKALRAVRVSLDSAPRDGRGSLADRLASGQAGPDEGAGRAERREAVERAMAALEPEHRAVIVLRDLESLNYEEIAEALDIPRGTVKSRLHRARLALHARLARKFRDG